MMNTFDLAEQVVVVTGGYGHLGRSISRGLVDHGADVVVMGRSADRFAAAFPNPGRITFVEGDVLVTESVRRAYETITERYGPITGLVNNAAAVVGQDPLGITDDEWAQTLDGVLGSAYRCLREVVEFMVPTGGSIVNVSSMYGITVPDFRVYEGHPEYLNPPHYGAAKAGLIHMTRYFSRLLGGQGIRVNAVSPGPFPNDHVQADEAFVGNLAAKTALGRIGQPEDLIGAFVFLLSDASSYVTGHNLVVDGGWTAGG